MGYISAVMTSMSFLPTTFSFTIVKASHRADDGESSLPLILLVSSLSSSLDPK